MVGIILAGGNGNRLKQSFDDSCCKPLVKIKEKALIEFSLDILIDLQIKNICIVVGDESDLIQAEIGSDYKGLNISYVKQNESDGLIGALSLALKDLKDEDIILQLADEVFVDFKSEITKKHIENPEYDFYCGFTYEDDYEKIKSNYSVEIDQNLQIVRCIEKPSTLINNLKGTGFCIFRHKALNILKKPNYSSTCDNLCDYINLLTTQNLKGLAFCIATKEFNINTFDDLSEACVFFSHNQI